jgi:hypothetical protein
MLTAGERWKPARTGELAEVSAVHDRWQAPPPEREDEVAFAARMIVYVGFIVYAALFYRNIHDLPLEAKTMPMMGVIAVLGLSVMLMASDVYRAVRGGGAAKAAVPLAQQAIEQGADGPHPGDGDRTADADERSVDEPAEPSVVPAAEQTEFGGDNLIPRRVYRYAVPAAMLVAAYIYFLPIVGYVIATIVFLAVLAALLGARSVVKIAVYAIVTPFAFQWLFETLLQLRLP